MANPLTFTPMEAEWDVVIIGAGPAGALAARQLALAGARALLVDRCAFPRGKVCGACVNQHALRLLESLGLRGVTGRLGGVPLRSWRLQSGGRSVQLPLAGGLAVSRSRFDAALVAAACRAGACFLPQTTAAVLPVESGRSTEFRHVRLSHGSFAAGVVQGRIILAADGLGHPSLRRSNEFQSRVAARSRIGLGATIGQFPGSFTRHCIFMAVAAAGYVGLVRVEDGALNVAAAIDPNFVKQTGGPEKALATMLLEAGLPNIPDLASATWRGTPSLTRQTRPLASTRLFLVGDAAGYVEPFTGEGIAWALASAVAVVPLVLQGIDEWSPHLAQNWSAIYRRQIDSRQSLCRLATTIVRHPTMTRGLIGLFSYFPSLGGQVVRRVGGSAALRPLPEWQIEDEVL